MSIKRYSVEEIIAATQHVYQMAGFDAGDPDSRIVSLFSLVKSFPLRAAELPNLTYESAIEYLARETGQTLPDAGEGKLSGFLYAYEHRRCLYGCILVEANDPVARRRFSAAHELGHYILHFMPLLASRAQTASGEALVVAEGLIYKEGDESDEGEPTGQMNFAYGHASEAYNLEKEIQRIEREANQFAAELLMPEPVCRALMEKYSRDFSRRPRVLARRLATEFLVSQAAMKLRLERLNLIEA